VSDEQTTVETELQQCIKAALDGCMVKPGEPRWKTYMSWFLARALLRAQYMKQAWNEWQPIETAPKNGDILVRGADGEIDVVYFFPDEGGSPRWVGQEEIDFTPTHWHALPLS
jgi:hypothetical protein